MWDGVSVCVVSSLLLCHPVLGRQRNVWIAVYSSSRWEGQGDWLDAALPGSAPLIKALKLINLCFHMVGCLRFLSLPSISSSLTLLLHLHLFNMDWCGCKWAWCILGYSYDYRLFPALIYAASPRPASTFLFRHPLCHLIIYSSFPLTPFLLSSLFSSSSPHPACRARLHPYQWVQSSEAEGERGSVITLHSPSPCISPTTAATVRREPGTKWSICWLNEKIAFFDC